MAKAMLMSYEVSREMGTPYIISDMNGRPVSTLNNGIQRYTYCLQYISNEPFNPSAFPVEVDDNTKGTIIPPKKAKNNSLKRVVTNAIGELQVRDSQQDS